jgi:hypothetical protein
VVDYPVRMFSSRWRMLLLLAGASALTAGGALMAVSASVFGRLIGVVGVAFFGLCAVYFLIEFVHRRPTVSMNGDGVVLRAQIGPAWHVRWDEISSVASYAIGRQILLGVHVDPDEGLIARASRMQAFFLRTNRRMGYPAISVPRHAVAEGLEAVVANMRRFKPDLPVYGLP